MRLRVFGLDYLLHHEDEVMIEKAIAEAEKITSGEIRVHLDRSCDIPILDRAAEVFTLLNMHETVQRNGVLIYLSKREKQFAIIGDAGINTKVPPGFWNETAENMSIYFKSGNYVKGILEGIESAGKELKKYFPVEANDSNELSNKVSYGKKK